MDEYGGWFRYHSLLREVLQAELEAREPAVVPELHRRAARWFEATGDLDAAVGHAFEARDLELAASLVGTAMVRTHWSGRRATTLGWLARFGDDALRERPWLAVLAAWERMSSGEPATPSGSRSWRSAARVAGRPPDGTASFESGRAILRACMGRGGAQAALRDATRALELEPVGQPVGGHGPLDARHRPAGAG